MLHNFLRKFFSRLRSKVHEIDPDEIFLDASNFPGFDTSQFEGRIERPVGQKSLYVVGLFFLFLSILFTARLFDLQVINGEAYAIRSEQNRLIQKTLFPERGVVVDRLGEELITNALSDGDDFAHRVYTNRAGFGHLLGYVSYPQKDTSGKYFQNAYVGKEGVEKAYESIIGGVSGVALVETDALGNIQSESVVQKAVSGATLPLTIDARVQEELFSAIHALSEQIGFQGGAGVIMDVSSGELLAITSYPEFDSGVLSNGEPQETIDKYVEDERKPFLNRAIAGLYTPGSIMKPYVAVGALEEGIISPEKKILSTGSISIPNPYDPDKPNIFKDWKAHGYVDMRQALAVSSNVYFYTLGGGYEDQIGLGINRLNKYFQLFGFGNLTGVAFGEEEAGTVPSIAWKDETFPGEPWRIGDTYNTSIGQYGFQVTAIQVARAVSALANGGTLVTPHVVAGADGEKIKLPVRSDHLQIIREGMREGVLHGTGQGLYFPELSVASKTGTAELDFGKKYVNSWVSGFFPYEHPQYAFAIVMEQGPRGNTIGGVYVMRQVLEYMLRESPEYTK